MIRCTGWLLALVSFSAVAGPPAGSLDPSFAGGTGIVFSGFGPEGINYDYGTALAETGDGGLLMAGTVQLVSNSTWCLGVTRHTPDGLPDPVFLEQTSFAICHDNPFDDLAEGNYALRSDLDLAVAPGGDFYIAGTALVFQPPDRFTYVCGFAEDGSKKGCVMLKPGGESLDPAEPSLVVHGQQLLVVTNTDGDASPILFRLALDDLAIESQSQIIAGESGATAAFAWDADLSAAGDLVIAGEARFGQNEDTDFIVARFDLNTNQPDVTFDGDGLKRIAYNVIADGKDSAHAVRALSNGDVLVAGRVERANSRSAFGIVRLNATGQAADSFNGGLPLTLFENFDANVLPWAIDQTPSGKIVASGMLHFFAAAVGTIVLRLHPDGSLDTGFAGGHAFFDFAQDEFDSAYGMVLQDERIVLGGRANRGFTSEDFMLFRVSDGRLFNDGFE